MAYLTVMKTLGLALEGSPYTYPQADLSAGDFDFKPYNIKYSTEIEEYKRLYALRDMSALSSIMGKRSGTVSFSVDMAYSGAVATDPEWAKIARACGWLQTTYTTTGIGWTLGSGNTAVPCVIEILETSEGTTPTQLAIQFRGAMGNMKLVLDKVGSPFRLDFEFKGVLQTIEDRASGVIRRPASYDTSIPSAVLGAAITAYGEALDLDKITIDPGCKVELFTDPAASEGYSGAHIVGREPKGTFDPYLAALSSRAYYTRMIAGTTGALSIAVGTSLTVTAPALQVVKGYGDAERSGASVNQLECIFTRSSNGDDELEILQGSKT